MKENKPRLMPADPAKPAEFDQYADTYENDLNRALSVSGEDKDYFAAKRVEWLARCVTQLGERPRAALDYGCGVGDTSVRLVSLFGLEQLVGVEVSPRSLELARARHHSDRCKFVAFKEYVPRGEMDLVYCNGVFHHIPPSERPSAFDYINASLRPGGLFALWENNPWNPGTRYVMSKCVFDRDAIPLTASESVRLLLRAGFEISSIHYRFIFPGLLRFLRFIEPPLARLPLGAQYQVLCRKPLRAEQP